MTNLTQVSGETKHAGPKVCTEKKKEFRSFMGMVDHVTVTLGWDILIHLLNAPQASLLEIHHVKVETHASKTFWDTAKRVLAREAQVLLAHWEFNQSFEMQTNNGDHHLGAVITWNLNLQHSFLLPRESSMRPNRIVPLQTADKNEELLTTVELLKNLVSICHLPFTILMVDSVIFLPHLVNSGDWPVILVVSRLPHCILGCCQQWHCPAKG